MVARHRTNDVLGVADLNVMVRLDITSSDDARTRRTQRQLRFVFTIHDERNALQIEQNLDDILLNAFDCRIFVQHTIDLDLSDGTTRH